MPVEPLPDPVVGPQEKAFRRRCALLGIVWLLLAIISFAVSLTSMMAGSHHPLLLFSLLLAAAAVPVAFGLRQCAGWSWLPALIIAVLMLPAVPVGTLLGGYSIYTLVSGKLYFGA